MNIPENVRVIAVSKLQPIEKIRALALNGLPGMAGRPRDSSGRPQDSIGRPQNSGGRQHKDFGENYLQEALPKIEQLKDLKLIWHFIGHLQTNKVKQVVGVFDYIHSVDSEKLLQKISQVANEQKLLQKILLQVNVAGEASKGGFEISEFEKGFATWQKLPGVEIVGLMTMPPLVESSAATSLTGTPGPSRSSSAPESPGAPPSSHLASASASFGSSGASNSAGSSNRPYFQELKKLSQKFSLPELSMGTSSDYEQAIAEGATMIRLGTVLFGERLRTKN